MAVRSNLSETMSPLAAKRLPTNQDNSISKMNVTEMDEDDERLNDGDDE